MISVIYSKSKSFQDNVSPNWMVLASLIILVVSGLSWGDTLFGHSVFNDSLSLNFRGGIIIVSSCLFAEGAIDLIYFIIKRRVISPVPAEVVKDVIVPLPLGGASSNAGATTRPTGPLPASGTGSSAGPLAPVSPSRGGTGRPPTAASPGAAPPPPVSSVNPPASPVAAPLAVAPASPPTAGVVAALVSPPLAVPPPPIVPVNPPDSPVRSPRYVAAPATAPSGAGSSGAGLASSGPVAMVAPPVGVSALAPLLTAPLSPVVPVSPPANAAAAPSGARPSGVILGNPGPVAAAASPARVSALAPPLTVLPSPVVSVSPPDSPMAVMPQGLWFPSHVARLEESLGVIPRSSGPPAALVPPPAVIASFASLSAVSPSPLPASSSAGPVRSPRYVVAPLAVPSEAGPLGAVLGSSRPVAVMTSPGGVPALAPPLTTPLPSAVPVSPSANTAVAPPLAVIAPKRLSARPLPTMPPVAYTDLSAPLGAASFLGVVPASSPVRDIASFASLSAVPPPPLPASSSAVPPPAVMPKATPHPLPTAASLAVRLSPSISPAISRPAASAFPAPLIPIGSSGSSQSTSPMPMLPAAPPSFPTVRAGPSLSHASPSGPASPIVAPAPLPAPAVRVPVVTLGRDSMAGARGSAEAPERDPREASAAGVPVRAAAAHSGVRPPAKSDAARDSRVPPAAAAAIAFDEAAAREIVNKQIAKMRVVTNEKLNPNPDLLVEIRKWVELNKEKYFKQAVPDGSVYVRASRGGPSRPVQFNADGTIFVHLAKRVDPVVGKGGNANVQFAYDYESGDVWVSGDILDRDIARQTVAGAELVKDLPGWLPVKYPVYYKGSRYVEKDVIMVLADGRERAVRDTNGNPILKKEKIPEKLDKMRYLSPFCNKGDLATPRVGDDEELLNKLRDNIARQILVNISRALNRGILHRDIKLANIFLHHSPSEGLKVFIADLSTVCHEKDDTRLADTDCTPAYMSPDAYVALNKPGARTPTDISNRARDIWSLGCALYQLYNTHQNLPWRELLEERNDINLRRMAETGERVVGRFSKEFAFNIETDKSALIFDLVKRMLEPNPEKRIKFHQLEAAIDHIWRSIPPAASAAGAAVAAAGAPPPRPVPA